MSFFDRFRNPKPEKEDAPRLPKLMDEFGHDHELPVRKLDKHRRELLFNSDGKQMHVHYSFDQSDDDYEATSVVAEVDENNKNATYRHLMESPPAKASFHSRNKKLQVLVGRDNQKYLPDGEVKRNFADDIYKFDRVHRNLNRRKK